MNHRNKLCLVCVATVCVLIFALIFNIQSVITFALPMMVGVISGCYSSICIAGPLWVKWQNKKLDKKVTLNKKSDK